MGLAHTLLINHDILEELFLKKKLLGIEIEEDEKYRLNYFNGLTKPYDDLDETVVVVLETRRLIK